ncbi:GNAT family N-acetyltransferase [Bacillus sp. 31A1R]|uniref:GNAT family N-acetyltransferase n=1 Tax=Robertmurraya mangrovi TaxID=3098077 RepID=A0ABU5IXW3_9BACI|nr:GNAT family N-acetyltransferase [Bacillus sp. 31A1R]MDZ5471998.1 GNAT family N-acetyltransferase [Bacillus sp. 31A1R]
MLIERATELDAKGIASVHVQSWRETYRGIINQEFLDSLKEESRYELWKESLKSEQNGYAYVAKNESGEIVGFASFGVERTKKFGIEAELYAIYLLDGYKGQKVGSKLFYAGLQQILKLNLKSLMVWVLNENPSKRFYESFQPEMIAEEQIKIGTGVHKEIAYSWNDLHLLNKRLEESIKREGVK